MTSEFITTEYHNQFTQKLGSLRAQFADMYQGDFDAFQSPAEGYRMRAEFKAWHQNGAVHYAMHDPIDKKPYIVNEFKPAYYTIQKLMPMVLDAINQNLVLKERLFQIEFLSSRSGDTLITLIYHKPLNESWLTHAKSLADQLNCQIIGRSRKQKLLTQTDYIYEEFEVHNKRFRYQQIEASFTQPNANVCEKMLNWAHHNIVGERQDLLELYCGNGNFTLPLSCLFNKTLATEISKTSIMSAKHNCQLNDINTIEFIRLSSEELTQALNHEREFRRLKNTSIEDFQFSHVLVDPPRSGLDEGTAQLIKRVPNIIYISCNPDTLYRDIQILSSTHKVAKMAFFDQFPFTPHKECGAVLTSC